MLTDERLRVDRNVFWFGAAAMYSIGGGLLLVAMLVDLVSPKSTSRPI